MFKLIAKIDIIVVVIIMTVLIGIAVIAMRSKTYSIGYEIAALKSREKQLRHQQIELQSEYAKDQRIIRSKLLLEQDRLGKSKYVLPDLKHVIKEE